MKGMVYTLYATAVPSGIRTGDFRSGPPPVGKTVVLTAVRVFTGTEGYKRRAADVSHEPYPQDLLYASLTLFDNVLEILHSPQIGSAHIVFAV